MPDETSDTLADARLLRLSAAIAAAYVSNHPTPPERIGELVNTVHRTLRSLNGRAPPPPAEKPKPAVPISKSVQPDHIVCLEDGKQLKMLKRYLRARYNLSPEEYRRKWGLPPDYPMVAPAYAQRRSAFARELGLGKGVRRKS
ncbi:MAG TPA: MucR family transcriptional regulator [Caulobacteraceae bacterium]|jgi:predicted transcriptional regulator